MAKKRTRTDVPSGRARSRGEPVDLGDGLTAEVFDGGEMGPGMTRADDETIFRSLRRFDPDRPWKKARLDVRPMLPRLRPLPFVVEEPYRTMLPPGILVGFGLDLGPALTVIDAGQLARWGVDGPTVAAAALDNVAMLAETCDPALVLRQSIAGTPVAALQTGMGIAAALLLVPASLRRLFGPKPALLVAPMRDLLLAMPADVNRLEAAWLSAEVEALDPNCLHMGGFQWDGERLRPESLDGAIAMA